MKEALHGWLDRLAAALIGWLLDVVLSDKIEWFEEQIKALPDELIKAQVQARGLDRDGE
jgi:hypothetical protein